MSLLFQACILPVGILAAVEVDILRRNITGVDSVVRLAEVEVHRDGETVPGCYVPQGLDRSLGHEPAFTGGLPVIGNVDEFFPDPGAGVSDRMDDPSPVGISPVP